MAKITNHHFTAEVRDGCIRVSDRAGVECFTARAVMHPNSSHTRPGWAVVAGKLTWPSIPRHELYTMLAAFGFLAGQRKKLTNAGARAGGFDLGQPLVTNGNVKEPDEDDDHEQSEEGAEG